MTFFGIDSKLFTTLECCMYFLVFIFLLQAFWGVPTIREPTRTDQTEPHGREIDSFFPKLPPPFFERQPGRNSAALDSIEISGEANIGRRNPISSQNPPSFPDEDDDEDDESYFGDDSELGEEKPFMNRPKTPEKPGNVPGFLGTAINPKGRDRILIESLKKFFEKW